MVCDGDGIFGLSALCCLCLCSNTLLLSISVDKTNVSNVDCCSKKEIKLMAHDSAFEFHELGTLERLTHKVSRHVVGRAVNNFNVALQQKRSKAN